MKTFTDTLLSNVGRVSGRLGIGTVLLDTIIERFFPQMTAQASCPPSGNVICGFACGPCCSSCNSDAKNTIYALYAPWSPGGGGGCSAGPQFCVYNCDFC